ncbi:hypothetical protein [Halomonas sp. E19]|jgi:hypothetical protein
MAPEVLLPLGILAAACLLFGSGLLWARHRDRQATQRRSPRR